jgi:hypothetical protein
MNSTEMSSHESFDRYVSEGKLVISPTRPKFLLAAELIFEKDELVKKVKEAIDEIEMRCHYGSQKPPRRRGITRENGWVRVGGIRLPIRGLESQRAKAMTGTQTETTFDQSSQQSCELPEGKSMISEVSNPHYVCLPVRVEFGNYTDTELSFNIKEGTRCAILPPDKLSSIVTECSCSLDEGRSHVAHDYKFTL